MIRVLLVEDNPINSDALSRRLQRRGFEVLCVFDGEQAVAAAHTERPDIILMDMNLPLLDGWQATGRIRSLSNGKDVPIVTLTAHAMAGDREAALAAGCDDYHSKPVDLARLLIQIEDVLVRKRATGHD